MTMHFLKSAALSVTMLLCTASIPAMAVDVGVSVGGGANAGASATSGNTSGTVTIGSGNGPLATVDSADNPNGGSQTDAVVNLGSLLDGLDLGGIGLPGSDGADGTDGSAGNAGAGGGGGYQAIANSLSAGDRQRLALRCQSVLVDPTIYKADVVEFCRMIVKLKM
jgi:hypothetical protein